MRFPITASLILSALPLAPVAAPAQAPPTSAGTKSAVAINLDFVLIKTSELDADRFHFDLVPLTVADTQPGLPQAPVSLEYAAGYPTTLLHQEMQKVTPASAFTRRSVSAPIASTLSDVPVTITVNEEVADFGSVDVVSGVPGFLPQAERRIRIAGSFTLTPHINADRSITLEYSLPSGLTTREASPRHLVQLLPIASGATLVIGGLYAPQPPGVYLSTAALLRLHQWTLLTFITPTLRSASTPAGAG